MHMLIPALESEPVFCEEHRSCDNWTVGLGATRASKIVSELMKGRTLSGLQIEAAMLGLIGDPRPRAAFRNIGRVVLDVKIAG